MMLGLGILILGIITPCLQIALAHLYFKNGHIWSRVLNSALERNEEEHGDIHKVYLQNWINTIRNILKFRVWY